MTDLSTGAPAWSDSPRTMALVQGALYFAGAAIGALTLLLPHPATADDPMLWTNVAVAIGAALMLVGTAGRLSPWFLQGAIACGTLLITRAVYLSDDPGTFYSVWYVWVGLYTFFFFGRFWGAIHMALIGIAYGWALIEIPQTSPLARWVTTIATIAIAGILIDVLTARVRNRAAESASRARSLSAVASVAHELARSTSPESAGSAVCASAVQVADASSAVLWEPASSGRGLVATAATDPALIDSSVAFVSLPSGAVRAFTSAEPHFVADSDEADPPDPRPQGATGSALFQPVSRDHVPIGVLAVYWDRRLADLTDELCHVIDLLSVEAAIAIERAETLARLERVARTDDLTGLPNRRAWDEHLTREVARARREGQPLAVAVLDLDNFKQYNDRHGHQAGDRFLKEVSANWQRVVRDTDILARYGGEEFALALPGAEVDDAAALLERLRQMTPRGERTSGGLVQWDGVESEAELVARADEALYAAKRGGRDRVIAA